jgi:transcriptional regulator with XRE-family HTH domain
LSRTSCYAADVVPEQPPEPLAAIRKRKLLSQRDLARQAGVALSTIYLLESGRTGRVTFKVMRSVSQALGVPPESIAEFRRTIAPEAPSP